MIADASRFLDEEEYEAEFAAPVRQQRGSGGRELSGRAKFARSSRHSRGNGGRAKLFNGAHLKRQNRHVSW